MKVRSLPPQVQTLCDQLHAPDRLVRHLILVHDVAITLMEQLCRNFPSLKIDAAAVSFGAATHDLGKVLHPNELVGPGREHEEDGPPLLERLGVEPCLARFAHTHGTWKHEKVELEDLIVALADNFRCGRRNQELEDAIISRLVETLGVEPWAVLLAVEKVAEEIMGHADERLKWQLGT